jgi:hypothetical protein
MLEEGMEMQVMKERLVGHSTSHSVVRECRDTAVPSLMALLSPDPTE